MRTRKALGILAMIPVMMVACTEGDTPAAPDVALIAAADHSAFEFTQHFIVCKEGTDANFQYWVYDNATGLIIETGTFPVADGTCEEIQFWDATDPVKYIEVAELPGPYVLTGTSCQKYAGLDVPDGPPEVGTDPLVANIISNDRGVVVTYYNEPGGEGCTPGYWKQEHHFDSWMGFIPDDYFFDVFGVDAFPGMTLVDVLRLKGGGLNALGRHTVAALLNASSMDVSYDLTVADVIGMFNAVYPGTNDEYEALKDMFEVYNEQGCPL
jgi:hypothetical protein